MPASPEPPVTPQTGVTLPRPETHGRDQGGAGERLKRRAGAVRAGGRRGPAATPPSRRPAPPFGEPPPRPRHLEEPASAAAAGTGASGTAAARSSPPRGPSAAPSTSRRGTPTSRPRTITSRACNWPSRGWPRVPAVTSAPPGPRPGGRQSAPPPGPPRPLPSRPIRRRVPPRPDPTRPRPAPSLPWLRRPRATAPWPQLTVRSHSGFSECLLSSALFPASGPRLWQPWTPNVPEHTALIVCRLHFVEVFDFAGPDVLSLGGPACVTQPGVQAQPLPPVHARGCSEIKIRALASVVGETGAKTVASLTSPVSPSPAKKDTQGYKTQFIQRPPDRRHHQDAESGAATPSKIWVTWDQLRRQRWGHVNQSSKSTPVSRIP